YAAIFAHNILKVPVDLIPDYNGEVRRWVLERFQKIKWYEVYDFVEHCKIYVDNEYRKHYLDRMNDVFVEERAGYRFSKDGFLMPISTEIEVLEVQASMETSSSDRFRPAREHLIRGMEAFAKRPV